MYLENNQLRTSGLCRSCRNGSSQRKSDGASNGTSVGACDKRPSERSWGLVGYPVASMYAPLQAFGDLYDNATALQRGTLFRELDLPFEGMTVSKGGCGCG